MIDDLLAALRPDQVSLDEPTRAAFAHDDAEWAPFALPIAVVHAESVEDVAAVLRAASRHGIPVVPRGAGSGLSGGANAVEGGLILSLDRMRTVLEINTGERYAVVQAGVINDDLRAAVAEHGLWYPPDPASSAISTIGGNVATNAGGICCVKYGVTRDYVLGLTVVLADGNVARLGRRTAKGTTGLDLTGLMVSSEGTLGVIVEIVLRLIPLAGREPRAVVGSFSSLTAAGEAVAAVMSDGIVPSALELVDRTCLEAVERWQQLGIPTGTTAMLLASVDEPGVVGSQIADRIDAHFRAAGGSTERATEPADIERLFRARRLAYPALERLGPVLTEDVCVPRGQVPTMLARIETIAAEHDVVIASIAHAGDGNLHPLIIAPEGDEDAKVRAKIAFDRIVEESRLLGGTVTGEHGVGLLKLDGAAAELDPVVLRMHAAVKHALDPAGILNPGKAFPPPPPLEPS